MSTPPSLPPALRSLLGASFPKKSAPRIEAYGTIDETSSVIGLARAHIATALRSSAVDAVRERKREKHVAIVGQDCIAEAMEEMSNGASPLIGSVSHEAGSYGPSLIHLGLSILRGQTVPPYNYVEHKMVTPESIAHA